MSSVPAPETQPLLSPPLSPTIQDASTIPHEHHSPAFDLGLARVSLLIQIVAYTFTGLTTSPAIFTVLSVVSALGDGFSPAVQSVALEMYIHRGGTENGRLFGALSVVQALGYVATLPVG
jgi:hypothetical protein